MPVFSKIDKLLKSSYVQIICLKDVPINVLHFVKFFGDKYGVRGSRFGGKFGSSRNHPESIGIDQDPLIGHLGMIKTP